ncbi:MAG: exodeoxyribonuclease III [Spirochaetia bacterium]
MRIATWNVNSLKARMDRVLAWLERTHPDVLLMQETKLQDGSVPVEAFRDAGYEIAHHGQGQWNGVAVLSCVGLEAVVTNFGRPLEGVRDPDSLEVNPRAEARMVAASCGGLRVVSLYAPNGRSVGSPHYAAKLVWFELLWGWLREEADLNAPLVLGGDLNVAPADIDVWDPAACEAGTHVSPPERQAFGKLLALGLTDAYRSQHPEPGQYTWWDYRSGNFHKNIGMRIDHLLISNALVPRVVWAEIDRDARKGKPTPSDHAPLVVDLDEPGRPFDAGWPDGT